MKTYTQSDSGEMVTAISVSGSSMRIEVGPWDEEQFDGVGGFAFGMMAEVFASEHYGTGGVRFEVSMGAIGSHSPEVGRRRAAAYVRVCDLAEIGQALSDGGMDDYAEIKSELESYSDDEIAARVEGSR